MNLEACGNDPFRGETTKIKIESHNVQITKSRFFTDVGSMTNCPPSSFPSSPLVVCTVVSVVTGVGTGSTVHVIFCSHIDSQSLFLPPSSSPVSSSDSWTFPAIVA